MIEKIMLEDIYTALSDLNHARGKAWVLATVVPILTSLTT